LEFLLQCNNFRGVELQKTGICPVPRKDLTVMLLMPVNQETASVRTTSNVTAAFNAVLRLGDPAMLIAGAAFAHWVRFGTPILQVEYVRLVVLTTVFALLVLSSKMYRSWRGRGLSAEVMHLGFRWSLVFVGVVLYATATQLTVELSRLWLGTWFAASLGGAVLLRFIIRGIAAWVRARGMDLRTAVIVGGNPDAQRIVDTMRQNPWMGIKLRGWFSTSA